MKTFYTVVLWTKCESNSISPLYESESDAREFFEKEKAKLSLDEPADITGWDDYNTGWSEVYKIELQSLTFDEDDQIEDGETIDETDYYYI